MDNLRVFLAFGAILSLSLFFARLKISTSLAPLCAVATVGLWLSFAGALGFLWFGCLFLYIFCAGHGLLLLWQKIVQKKALPHLGFGFLFFFFGALFFILLLWAKKPLFTGWDEFSLWGTASKLMKQNNQLYTVAPIGWIWTQTQKPAYMLQGYFFQFFGSGFVPWQTYAACNVFMLALMASLFAPFDGAAKKHWNSAVPLAVFALLVPFVFFHYEEARAVSPAYVDTLADIPLGLCLAAVFAAWYGAKNKEKLFSLLPVCLAAALLTMIKDTGFSLALVAVGVICVDGCLQTKPKFGLVLGFFLRFGLLFSSVLLPFVAWDVYAGVLSGKSRMESAVTSGGVGLLQAPVLFLKEALSKNKSPFFKEITGGMVRFFFFARGNMLGTGFVIALLVFGFLLLSIFVCNTRQNRRQCAVFAIFSSLGFLAYYFFVLTTSYLYILRPEQALSFESYERYVFPYYIGWLLCAVVIFCKALAQSQNRQMAFGKLAFLGFAALVFFRVGQLVMPKYSIFGVHKSEYNQQREFAANAKALEKYFSPDDRIFYVKSGDIGLGWFMLSYHLLPYQLDYSFGGVMEMKQALPEGGTQKRALSKEEFLQYLRLNNCSKIYIDYADQEFIDAYGTIFKDGLAACKDGSPAIYAVEKPNDKMQLSLIVKSPYSEENTW